MARICVFCGSSPGNEPKYIEAARETGILCAKRGIEVVYGGASIGTMGALADATLEAGGQVLGVIPESMVDRELAHQSLTELFIVDSMDARKNKMLALSDAFISLPGGMGTLDEAFEVLTLAQLDYHRKPHLFVNLDGYYSSLLAWGQHAREQGLIPVHALELIQSVDTPAEAIARLTAIIT